MYQQVLRFNKMAAKELDLPQNIVFDFDSMRILFREDGFPVVISKSWCEHVIYSRPLCKHILDKFDADKILFAIIKESDQVYTLRRISEDVPVPGVDVAEMKNMIALS